MSKTVLGIIALIANGSITLTGVLVILKVLPYNILGGGRMPDYKSAVMLTTFSIIVQLFLMYCTLVASEIVQNVRLYKASRVVLIIFIVYFIINIFMNLMGKTWFERIYASLVCIVQIVCFIFLLT